LLKIVLSSSSFSKAIIYSQLALISSMIKEILLSSAGNNFPNVLVISLSLSLIRQLNLPDFLVEV
jgi:hypothetical protein